MIISKYNPIDKVIEDTISSLIGPQTKWLEQHLVANKKPTKLNVIEASQALTASFNPPHFTVISVEIEIRPSGILLVLNNKIQQVAWAIPFYRLAIFKTEYWVVHGDGQKVLLIDPKWRNKAFFNLLLQHKNALNQIDLN